MGVRQPAWPRSQTAPVRGVGATRGAWMRASPRAELGCRLLVRARGLGACARDARHALRFCADQLLVHRGMDDDPQLPAHDHADARRLPCFGSGTGHLVWYLSMRTLRTLMHPCHACLCDRSSVSEHPTKLSRALLRLVKVLMCTQVMARMARMILRSSAPTVFGTQWRVGPTPHLMTPGVCALH